MKWTYMATHTHNIQYKHRYKYIQYIDRKQSTKNQTLTIRSNEDGDEKTQ